MSNITSSPTVHELYQKGSLRVIRICDSISCSDFCLSGHRRRYRTSYTLDPEGQSRCVTGQVAQMPGDAPNKARNQGWFRNPNRTSIVPRRGWGLVEGYWNHLLAENALSLEGAGCGWERRQAEAWLKVVEGRKL